LEEAPVSKALYKDDRLVKVYNWTDYKECWTDRRVEAHLFPDLKVGHDLRGGLGGVEEDAAYSEKRFSWVEVYLLFTQGQRDIDGRWAETMRARRKRVR